MKTFNEYIEQQELPVYFRAHFLILGDFRLDYDYLYKLAGEAVKEISGELVSPDPQEKTIDVKVMMTGPTDIPQYKEKIKSLLNGKFEKEGLFPRISHVDVVSEVW